MTTSDVRTMLTPGTPVEVRSSFDGHWIPGFYVEHLRPEHDDLAIDVRRAADDEVLPASFSAAQVRPIS